MEKPLAARSEGRSFGWYGSLPKALCLGTGNVTEKKETNSRLDKLAVLMRRIGYFGGDRAHFALGRLLYRLSIVGEEHIPRDGPCLFSMNHVALAADALIYLTIRRHRPDIHVVCVELSPKPLHIILALGTRGKSPCQRD